MMWVEQLITSFIASAAFGLIFNVPKRMLLQCGSVGMAGWFMYMCCVQLGVDVVPSTLIAVVVVTVISQLFARMYKTPIIVFNVSGIIPLVPGGIAYDAMRNVVENNYNAALELGFRAFMLSGTIAIGLVLSEVVNQLLRKSARR
ncbi:threonine/serine exporter family protein [Paenibacillus radicis (ex Gao et al. 2016)]|uniref:Membrane protein n=1 Tax=Paenibacillus radicis (ex Gao et al. 2016) TaxID=1737354 RepID=A0A917HAT2_9BACL|nr:threonine/serine exporter family protein [Paenibacillus radicis (ex Gao et al. 2016)]GGG73312.1 membrane protein [Paenibacillus radicis (ex Gao et al. 2016)]